jgi:hypothetical protein
MNKDQNHKKRSKSHGVFINLEISIRRVCVNNAITNSVILRWHLIASTQIELIMQKGCVTIAIVLCLKEIKEMELMEFSE